MEMQLYLQREIRLELEKCDEFLKEEHIGIYMSLGIFGTCLKENYSKMLMVIQKYFTCEGRFHMIYQYHFRLLLHFTVKQPLDLPFFLFRILGKMDDKYGGFLLGIFAS